MTTDAASQNDSIIAKDLLIAMISMPNRVIELSTDPAAAAQQIAQAYETIYNKVKVIT